MPRKVFVAGEILTAADVNTNLMDQAVMVFDDSAARTAAIPTPSEGMVTYLKDTNAVEKYDGSNFVAVSQPGILQVVQTVKTDTFTTSSTSFTDVTGLTVSITPTSASSKILVMSQYTGSTDLGTTNHLKIIRGSTDIYIGAASSSRIQASSSMFARGGDAVGIFVSSLSGAHTFLDNPATTSALTYKMQIRSSDGGTVYINRSGQDTDNAVHARTPSSITVMEVAV